MTSERPVLLFLNAQFFYFWTPSSFIQIYQKFENKTSERFRHGNCVRDEIFWMYKNNMLNKATLDTSDVFFVIKIDGSGSEEIYLFTVGIILKLNISYISMQCRTILQYGQWTAWYHLENHFYGSSWCTEPVFFTSMIKLTSHFAQQRKVTWELFHTSGCWVPILSTLKIRFYKIRFYQIRFKLILALIKGPGSENKRTLCCCSVEQKNFSMLSYFFITFH